MAEWVTRNTTPPDDLVDEDAGDSNVALPTPDGPRCLVKPAYAPPRPAATLMPPLLPQNVAAVMSGEPVEQDGYDSDDGECHACRSGCSCRACGHAPPLAPFPPPWRRGFPDCDVEAP